MTIDPTQLMLAFGSARLDKTGHCGSFSGEKLTRLAPNQIVVPLSKHSTLTFPLKGTNELSMF